MSGSAFFQSLPATLPPAERRHLENFYASMPLRLQDAVNAAALIDRASQDTVQKSVGLIDHTSLKDGPLPMTGAESAGDIVKLCADAKDRQGFHAAAVCVYPNHIETAAAALAGGRVRLAVVNNFPHGDAPAADAAADARASIAKGAREIDTVIDYAALKAGDASSVREKLRAVAGVCGERGADLKIILKAGVYETYDALHAAAALAIDSGQDAPQKPRLFIKTCTGKNALPGFGPGGADAANLLTAATVMQAVAESGRRDVGVKISGGVKTATDCARMRHLAGQILGPGFFRPDFLRFGASSLLGNLDPAGSAPKPSAATPAPGGY